MDRNMEVIMKTQEKSAVAEKDKIGVWGKLCYSIGYAGENGFQTIFNSYCMIFLMSVGGVSTAFVGTMMMLARIWDAINDPILGTIADHTNTRWGKYRPYFIGSIIPMAILFVALFSVPPLGTTGKMIYYTIVYILYGMCYTVVEVPYFGMVGAMSNDPQERASVTAWSRIAARIPAFAMPLLLGYMTATLGDQKGYSTTAIIIGAIAIVTALFSFFGCKEKAVQPQPEKKKGSAWKDFLNVLRGNRALLVVMLVQLFFTFNSILCEMLNTYYVTYSLGSPGLITGVAVSLVAVGACIGQFFYPYVLTKLKSCKTVMLIGTPIYIGTLALSYFMGRISLPAYLVVLVLSNMLVGALQINVIQLCFEVCDVLEYKNHVRTDATVFSVVSFLMKLAAGAAATIAGWGLKLCGFQGMGPVMGEVTQSMANGVAILRFAMPGCLALVAFLLCFLYPIKREEIVQVREALAQRHEAES